MCTNIQSTFNNAAIDHNHDEDMLKMGTLWIKNLTMRMIWLGTLLLIASTSAQAATYAYRNDVFSYDTPSTTATTVAWHASGASPACTNYPLGDDDWADVTCPTGFTFAFAGVAQNSVRVYSNGMLAFGTDTSGYWRQYSNLTLPITAASGQTYSGCPNTVPSNLIIPYWTDIVAGTANSTSGASVQYELLGTAPNRRIVISWVNVKLYGQTARYNFQVALYESPAGGLNSNFKFQYTTGSSTGSAATVGVQVGTTDYTLYSYNQAFIDPVAGSAILWYPANQLAGKSAEYRFDEAIWNGTPGEVKDTSGNVQNAVHAGGATNVSGGKVCRGGSFTSNTSNKVMDVVATPIAPASVGAIDFWFNSNVKWNSANAMLLDATPIANRPFFLMKASNGALTFSVTDSSGTNMTLSSSTQSFSATTWHHVGVSWNLKPGTNQTLLQIFLDGVLTASQRYTSNGSIYAQTTLDIGDNATNNVTPNGGTPNGANGIIDEVNIYPIEISAPQAAYDMIATHSCVSVDHFHVIHNGSAVTCDITPVTIEAHDINHALVALSGVSLSLSTSLAHGNWSSVTGGSLNTITNNGNGSGSYVFSNESKVTFGLQDPATVAESMTIGAVSGTVTTTSGSAAICTASDYTNGSTCNTPLSFTLAGFIFSDSAGGTSVTLPAQVAGTSSSTYYLRAVKASTTTQACVAALTGTTAVNFAYECNNPTTCSGNDLMSVNGGASTIISRNNNGNVSSYSAVNMTFDSNGNAPFTFNFGDAGKTTLYASKSAGGFLPSAITGASNAFVVAPASFAFSNITASPIKAGGNFSATVTALTSTGNVTPNFGNETTAESVTLSLASRVAPTGVNDCTNGRCSGIVLGSVTLPWAGGGATASNLTYSEVGQITLSAMLASQSYLGSGLSPSGTSSTVGDFVPAYFDTAVTPSCGSFTYSGQPFNVMVTAKNTKEGTTVNYSNLTSCSVCSKDVTLSDPSAATNFNNTNIIAANTFTKGVGSNNAVTYTFPTKTTAPATITLRAVDSSVSPNVTSNVTTATYPSHVEGNTPIRSGRVRLLNAYGSELLDLPVTMRAEYWNNNSWAINSADGCTGNTSLGIGNAVTLALTNITLNPTKTCVWDVASPGLSGAGCTTAGIATKQYKEGPVASFAGDFNLWLKAPGSSNSGAVGITATVPSWLRYNWTGTVANPSSRATFGIYKTPIIYLRENY